MSLFEITSLKHSYGDKVLYQNESLALFKGEHMGIVGPNGAGKSTLIEILTGNIIPDHGRVVWYPNVKVGYLDQHAVIGNELTIHQYLKTAFKDLYQLEEKIIHIYEQYTTNNNDNTIKQAAKYQATLEAKDFYLIDSRIEKVMNGLGLTSIGGDRQLSELSGGQRAKVILAKLLLEEPEVLLLDEPTNYLDKEHMGWLSDYLSSFANAFAVISHDYDFLEKVSTCICSVEAGRIRKYTGKYSEYLKQEEHNREDHIRRYESQQQQIKRTEEFIRKNIAGIKSRNAKGRRKQLERLERIAPPSFSNIKPKFHFLECSEMTQDALIVKNLEVGYYYPLLPPLNFSIGGNQKVVITGFNGIGKSTLLKTLMKHIPKIAGTFTFATSVHLNYYEQDLVWDDPSMTPLQVISAYVPSLSTKEVRRHLSLCGISNDHVMQAVGTLSGGEQAKVKLCKLMLTPCNFLILDEPTNHLDSVAKEAFQAALINFKGSLLLVTHEENFYKSWADQIINIDKIIISR